MAHKWAREACAAAQDRHPSWQNGHQSTRKFGPVFAPADCPDYSVKEHNIELCVILYIDVLWEVAHDLMMIDVARTPEQIGNLIRRTRKKLGWSQQALGNKAGLRQETISLIENGNPATRIETLLAILSALELEFHVGPRTNGWDGDIESLF